MKLNRRTFFKSSGIALASQTVADAADSPPIDFRYSPLQSQAAFCFPDDSHKSLVGESGDLRLGHQRGQGIRSFELRVQFTLRGMEADRVTGQRLEAPGIPVIRTRIERPAAFLDLTTFASNRENEGRVDNVVFEVRPRSRNSIHATPVIRLTTRRPVVAAMEGETTSVRFDGDTGPLCFTATAPLTGCRQTNEGWEITFRDGQARTDAPLRLFFRFPQESQPLERVRTGLDQPDALLDETLAFWHQWRPCAGNVDWQVAGVYNDFLTACARNILQAREVVDGKLTFQVGPTVYRGLWVVDGHFLLEAARYLGYDKEAQQGLETTWNRQREDGGIFAGGGDAHWKDTGIAMFSMVRQAELSQDWSYFREMKPNILRGVGYLMSLREKAREEGSANGRYGLLARGMGDGGLGGIRSEFTTTLWVLAGLKAVVEAAGRLNIDGYDETRQFYSELRRSFFAAAKEEMRRHPDGFDFLPMLMKEDPDWTNQDPWNRPRPQVGQWAMSQAIYPGLVFDHGDPLVRGYVKLMQACTQEGIPAETGWVPHEGLWTYMGAFVAHAYLWAGVTDWASSTFHGFLNHATPLYCWREEQPIQNSCVGDSVGDMPHNWASAECVLYLRHMLALEDCSALRLLAGIGEPELRPREPYRLRESPTRFGRVTMNLEPSNRGREWRLEFKRLSGPAPAALVLPARLGGRLPFASASGASFRRDGDAIRIAPDAGDWTCVWRT